MEKYQGIKEKHTEFVKKYSHDEITEKVVPHDICEKVIPSQNLWKGCTIARPMEKYYAIREQKLTHLMKKYYHDEIIEKVIPHAICEKVLPLQNQWKSSTTTTPMEKHYANEILWKSSTTTKSMKK